MIKRYHNIKYHVERELNSRIEIVQERDYVLDGTSALVERLIENSFKLTTLLLVSPKGDSKTDVTKELIKSTPTQEIVYPLRPCTSDDIENFRKNKKKSIFVLAENGNFFYAEIPHDATISSSSLAKGHCCGFCNRVSAASDQNGGCRKVRDFKKKFERYPWISKGFETIHTDSDCFIVLNCAQQEAHKTRKNYSPSEIASMKLRTAHYVFDDVETLADVRKRTANSSFNIS